MLRGRKGQFRNSYDLYWLPRQISRYVLIVRIDNIRAYHNRDRDDLIVEFRFCPCWGEALLSSWFDSSTDKLGTFNRCPLIKGINLEPAR